MLRVRYRPTDLGEGGLVEVLDVDRWTVLEDHSVKLYRLTKAGKRKVVGTLHPDRWDSLVEVREVEDDHPSVES